MQKYSDSVTFARKYLTMKFIILFFATFLLIQCKTINQNLMTDYSKIKSERSFFDTLGEIYSPVKTVNVERASIAGLTVYWFIPENFAKEKILIYLHGGSYYMGSINSHRSMLSHFADKLNLRILFVEYPLAPENTYPVAINKVANLYEMVLKSFPPEKVVLMGDSAGGGLLVSMLSKIKMQNFPSKTIMISPWLNLEANSGSYTENAVKDKILKKEDLLYASELYAADVSKTNPSRIKFDKFPETLIFVGKDEIILDDAINFGKQNKGTTVKLFENVSHVWPLTNISSKESVELIDEIKTFLNEI